MQYEEWQPAAFAAELARQGIRPERFATMLEDAGWVRSGDAVKLWMNTSGKMSMPSDRPLREVIARLLGVPYERLVRTVEDAEA